MGVVSSCCDSCCMSSLSILLCSANFPLVRSRRSQQYEPLLLENEREAVADLLQYLESQSKRFFFFFFFGFLT